MGFLKRLFSSEDNSQGKTKNQDKISNNLDENLDKLKKSFSYPNNQDFKVRELYLESIEKKVVLILLKGMVDNDTIEQHIIHPLLEDIPIRKK
ncbi:spore germination protein [Orenia marismortui]|uniref:spore germination protein n=1 Tax=Orenia marismortui TaxID=46469 RepID=UPI00035CBF9D|nr:spore germination protein [Orenia marismortui]